MMDRYIGNCKQATVDFIEARVTATLNKTLPWLSGHSPREQQSIVDFAVKMGASLRKEYCTRRKAVSHEINKRNAYRGKKKDMAYRNDLQKTLRQCIASTTLTPLLSEPIYANLSPESLMPTLKSFFNDLISKKDLTNFTFKHTWEEEDGNDEVYNARILSFTRRKDGVPTFKIDYNIEGFPNPELADAWLVTAEALLYDILYGDIIVP